MPTGKRAARRPGGPKRTRLSTRSFPEQSARVAPLATQRANTLRGSAARSIGGLSSWQARDRHGENRTCRDSLDSAPRSGCRLIRRGSTVSSAANVRASSMRSTAAAGPRQHRRELRGPGELRRFGRSAAKSVRRLRHRPASFGSTDLPIWQAIWYSAIPQLPQLIFSWRAELLYKARRPMSLQGRGAVWPMRSRHSSCIVVLRVVPLKSLHELRCCQDARRHAEPD